jgi:HK97 family phage portal protein
MAFPFFGRKQTELTPRDKTEADELMSYAEALNENGATRAMEVALEKALSGTEYYQYVSGDDGGNYFGSEHNIIATAARIKSMYAREPWMFATALLIARTLASVKFNVVSTINDAVNPAHPLNKKLDAASTLQDSETLKWVGYLDLILGGNFVLLWDAGYRNAIVAPIENVQPKIADDYMSVEGFWVFGKGTGAKTFVPANQAIHFKFPNPYTPYWGMSLYTAASRPLLLDRIKSEFEFSFYLRGGTSQGIVETTEDINKTRMKRLLRTFENTYTGKRNWWRQIFLPKGAKWVSTGFNFEQMKHFEGLRENRLALLAVLGVPPSKVGIIQDVNRSTSETQDKDLWTNTIMPLANFIAAGWNNSYLVKTVYGGLVKVVPDFSEVEALQGSLEVKGAQAKALDPYFWIDEIREKVFKSPPLPNNKGQMFVAEVRGSGGAGGGLAGLGLTLQLPAGVSAVPSTGDTAPALPAPDDEPKSAPLASLKASVAASQERIERTLGGEFLAGYNAYKDTAFAVITGLIRSAHDVQTVKEQFITGFRAALPDLRETFLANTASAYKQGLERGFSFANSNAKTMSAFAAHKSFNKNEINLAIKNGIAVALKSKFDETDQQAIDYLRAKEADGQYRTLAARSIERFDGMSETTTNQVVELIGDMLADPTTTLEKIAENIRSVHDEKYGDQSFTIARNEVLSAVSQGMKWNHDVLHQVFTDVEKQWFHIGDAGSNPNARDWHLSFEQEGSKPYGYKWGGVLEYPRDPSAEAKETINCRCTMVSVVPEGASSNAEVILERT